MTMLDWFDKVNAPKTYYVYNKAIENMADAFLGEVKANSINGAELEGWRQYHIECDAYSSPMH